MKLLKDLFKTEKQKIETGEVLLTQPIPRPTVKKVIVKEKPLVKKVTSEVIQKSILELINDINISVEDLNEEARLRDKLNQFHFDNSNLLKKIDNLKKVGLTNTPSVRQKLNEFKLEKQKLEDLINKATKDLEEKKREGENKEKYALKYPFFKYITYKKLNEILLKYDLVLGDSQLYNREIPDKVLDKIINFEEDINKNSKDYFIQILQNKKISSYDNYAQLSITDSDKVKSSDFFYISYLKFYSNNNLKIVAPNSHFNKFIPLSKEIYDKQKLTKEVWLLHNDKNHIQMSLDAKNVVNQLTVEVEDPIALLDTGDGYIIIDAWDKEAEIPEIKNPNWN